MSRMTTKSVDAHLRAPSFTASGVSFKVLSFSKPI